MFSCWIRASGHRTTITGSREGEKGAWVSVLPAASVSCLLWPRVTGPARCPVPTALPGVLLTSLSFSPPWVLVAPPLSHFCVRLGTLTVPYWNWPQGTTAQWLVASLNSARTFTNSSFINHAQVMQFECAVSCWHLEWYSSHTLSLKLYMGL